MALQFMIRANKNKEARVNVLRIVLTEGKLKKKVGGFETIGTLKAFDAEYLKQFAEEKQLTDEEIFELENYVSYLLFNKKEFKSSFSSLKREFSFFDETYLDSIFRLWQLAKKHNLSFCPADTMQSALLNKAKAIERKINQIQNEPVNILEAMGVNLAPLGDKSYREQVSKDCLKLFKLILTISKPIETLCEEFKQIAWDTYRKKDNVKAHYFKQYAKDLKRLPMWYNTVAIDLLVQNEKNPLEVLKASSVADNWVRMRKDSLSADEAFKQFIDIFHPKSEDEADIKAAIAYQYQMGISTAND